MMQGGGGEKGVCPRQKEPQDLNTAVKLREQREQDVSGEVAEDRYQSLGPCSNLCSLC